MSEFKPKSIEELNADFEEKFALARQEREKESAIDDDLLSEEQREFYRVSPREEPEDENEAQKEIQQEETFCEPQEEIIEEIEEKVEEADEYESDEQSVQVSSDEPEEINELFEAERLSQQETELFEANNLANSEAAALAAANSCEDVSDQEEAEIEEEQEPAEAEPAQSPVFYFKDTDDEPEQEEPAEEEKPQRSLYFEDTDDEENTDSVQETEPAAQEKAEEFVPETPKVHEEVKLTTHEDIKNKKKAKKQSKHRTAKTVFNTLISIVVLVCLFINGVVFMADVPRRFLGGYGITVCEHSIEGSNINSGSLLITKKASVVPEKNIVAALTKDKKAIVDFKQNIPDDAKVYSKVIKLVPKAGGAVKFIRGHWLESVCVELAVLLVLLIIRVAVSDKKEKTEKPEKKKESKKNK